MMMINSLSLIPKEARTKQGFYKRMLTINRLKTLIVCESEEIVMKCLLYADSIHICIPSWKISQNSSSYLRDMFQEENVGIAVTSYHVGTQVQYLHVDVEGAEVESSCCEILSKVRLSAGLKGRGESNPE